MRRIHLAVVIVIGAASAAMLYAARPGIAQDGATARAAQPSIGVVDVLTLVEQMLQQDEYATRREDMADALSTRIEEIQNELISLSQQLQSLEQGDPRGPQLAGELQSRRQAAQQFQEQSLAEFQQLSASQASEVYTRVREAVDTVADREGYSHVLASREGSDLSASTSLPSVTQEVLARPVLTAPEGDDLTAAVRTELGLPDPSEMPGLDEGGAGIDIGTGATGESGQDSPETDDEGEGGESP